MGSEGAVVAPSERERDRTTARRPRPSTKAAPQARSGSEQHLLALQASVGNQAVVAMLGNAQTKLRVGAADDPYEREADQVAQRVVAAIRSGQAGPVSDEADPVTAELEAPGIRRRPTVGAAGGDLDPGTESDLLSQVGRGRPLDRAIRGSMESAFGSDFAHVRVHDDSRSAQLNERVQAKAFTVGSDIFLGSASSPRDQELLAHELTHVVQQQGPRS